MGFDYALNKKAYKAVRERIRNVMMTKPLDKPAILSIAKQFLDDHYPDAYVDLNDLCGACLYWQNNGGTKTFNRQQ